jgi:type IV secretory pathway VirB4 component
MFGNKRKVKKKTAKKTKEKNQRAAIHGANAMVEVWGEHAPTIQDIIATASQAVFKTDRVEIAPHNFRRTYYVTRMPSRTRFGFLNQFFGFGADVDVSVHVEPADNVKQIKKITDSISSLEAQNSLDVKADKKSTVALNQSRIYELEALRLALQTGEEKMYLLSVIVTVSADSVLELERACAVLEREGPGRGYQLIDAADLQQEGLLSVAPLGINKLRYPMEVFGSYIANMFPFVSSQFSHKRGVLVGFDLVSKAPMFYDAWADGVNNGSKKLTNANMFIAGVSGSGKSYALKGIISHSLLHDIQTALVDWDGEYVALAKTLGGAVVSIDYNTVDKMNPCELQEVEYIDEKTGQKMMTVDIDEKIEEMVQFTKYAASLTGSEALTGSEIAVVDRLWKQIYRQDFGFTEDASSLYEPKRQLTGNRLQMKIRRKQPRFSDFYKALVEEAKQKPKFAELADRLERMTEGNTLGLFDCYSTLQLEHNPFVVFDLSKLSENSDLRKLGQYVALEWIVERFIKKNPRQKKRVIMDEAQKALENREGTPSGEYAAMFLDNAFTRIRKRGGSAVAASQQFRIFAASQYGASIIRNSDTKLLLKQERLDEEMLREMFSLAEHELERLYDAEPGDVRWDVGGEITYTSYQATKWEDKLWNTRTVESE